MNSTIEADAAAASWKKEMQRFNELSQSELLFGPSGATDDDEAIRKFYIFDS
jgi:hypothetical protein